MPVTGSCHCGAIRYTLDEPVPTVAMACNCSICRRRGYLLHFSTPDKFALEADPAVISEYRFGSGAISHSFCTICGCAPHGVGTGPDGKDAVVLNLRCADDVDLDSLSIQHFDGASL